MSTLQGCGLASIDEIAAGGVFADGDWVESKDQDPAGDVRLTQLADVGVAHFRNRSDRWMRVDQAERLRCTYLRPGDVLIARMPEPIGRACVVPDSIGQAVTAVDVAVLRISRPDVDSRYVMWALNAPSTHEAMVAAQSGTTRKRIARRKLGNVTIPLPAIDEQRRIVDVVESQLSRLDAAVADLVTTRDRLAGYQRAALHRLTENAASKHIQLGDALATIEAGRSFGGADRPSTHEEWGIVKVSAMTWGEFRPGENKLVSDQSKVDLRHQIHAGDLLMSRANTSEYVGAPVLVRSEAQRLLLSDKSLRLVPSAGTSAEYLWRVLSAPRARAQISARASGNQDSMRNISQSTLRTIAIPWTEHQQSVIDTANRLDAEHERLAAALERGRSRTLTLRCALLHAAFSGQLAGRSSDLERAEELINT